MGKIPQVLKLKNNISMKQIKQNFALKFPNSPILQTILSLPDEIDPEELIGASAILLSLLDKETNNNIKGGK